MGLQLSGMTFERHTEWDIMEGALILGHVGKLQGSSCPSENKECIHNNNFTVVVINISMD